MFIYVKNRFKGFSQKSYVYNEDGDKLFLIKGKLLSLSNKTDLRDMDGNNLFTIKTKIFHIFKNCVSVYKYEEKKKKLFCKIKSKKGKYFKVLKCDYNIRLDGRIDDGIAISLDDEEIAFFEEYETEEKTFNVNSYELEIYDDANLGELDNATISAVVIGVDVLLLKLNKE
jgi:uncharacterized protein YxjI